MDTDTKILEFYPGRGRVVAEFDAECAGWRIFRCMIKPRADGTLMVQPPRIRHRVNAVNIPSRYWLDFTAAALAAYEDWAGKRQKGAGRAEDPERDEGDNATMWG